MLRNTAILLILSLAATGCNKPQAFKLLPSDPAEVAAINIKAFQTIADTSAFHSTGTIGAICLSQGVPLPPEKMIQVPMIGYTDPSPILLQALASHPIPVVPGSLCWADTARQGMIADTSVTPHRTAMAVIMSPPEKVREGLYRFLMERAFDLRTARGFRCSASGSGAVWDMDRCYDGWIVD